MILVLGGKYQGKLDFAREQFELREAQVHYFGKGTALPDNAPILAGYELLVREQLQAGLSPLEELGVSLQRLEGKIVLFEDIFCGLVPTDPLDRRWREEAGRCSVQLAAHARQVYRVFCGIGTRIK